MKKDSHKIHFNSQGTLFIFLFNMKNPSCLILWKIFHAIKFSKWLVKRNWLISFSLAHSPVRKEFLTLLRLNYRIPCLLLYFSNYFLVNLERFSSLMNFLLTISLMRSFSKVCHLLLRYLRDEYIGVTEFSEMDTFWTQKIGWSCQEVLVNMYKIVNWRAQIFASGN